MAQPSPQSNQPNDNDEMLAVAIVVGLILIAAFFYGKDAIIAYWKGLSFLWFGLLSVIHPSANTALDFKNLRGFDIAKISWSQASQFNHVLNWYFSIGHLQLFSIFWAILPAIVAYRVRNKGKNLKMTFTKPWDLALYLSGHFPWMLPVIRERGKTVKKGFKDFKSKKFNKKASIGDRLNWIVQREKGSDWALHPMDILIKIGAFQKAKEGEKGALQTKAYGFWKIADDVVSHWTAKQLGAKAGRDGFSTPARNALFHAFVAKNPMIILKGYAAGGDRVINKVTHLSKEDAAKFKSYKEKHAYEVTILLSALAEARKNGILPPRWFVWLKYRDRALWYALHGLGMPRPHSEGLPGLVQWHCERRQKAPITVPQSQFVKSGLVDAMEEVLWEKSRQWEAFVKASGV